MRRIDLLIGGVIVLAIIFSFVGVATYDAVSGDQDFTIVWESTSNAVSAPAGQRVGNGDVTVELPINFDNITSVDLVVRVTASGPRTGAVTAAITITPRNASAASESVSISGPSQSAGNAEKSFSIPVHETPNSTTASGASENETKQELAQEHTSKAGRGAWTVKVTFSGGPAGVGPLNTGAETYRVTVEGKANTYVAALQPLTPDIER